MTANISSDASRTRGLQSLGRRLANAPFYLKLFSTLLIITVLTVVSLLVMANRVVTNDLIVQVGNSLNAQARERTKTIANVLSDQLVGSLQTLAMNSTLKIQTATQNWQYLGSESTIRQQITDLDSRWANITDDDPAMTAILNNASTRSFQEYTTAFPDNLEIIATDQYGALVASSIRTSDYNQSDEEWWQATWNGGQGAMYLSQPQFDDSTQAYSIIVSVPIYSINNDTEIVGVLRSTYRLDGVLNTVFEFKLGETGGAALYVGHETIITQTGQIPLDAESSAQIANLQAAAYAESTFEGAARLVSLIQLAQVADKDYIKNLDWHVLAFQTTEEALAPVTSAMQATAVIGIGIGIVAALLSFGLSQFIARPLRRLMQTARQLGAGDLSQRAPILSNDEFGQMAQTLNTMAEQLQTLVVSLEDRVATRTRDLATVTDVNAQISTILDPDRLLQDVADLTKERFRLYHAHIYLLNDDRQTLALAAGAGHVGRQMVAQGKQIDLNNAQSIVAQAARSRQGVIINDVHSSPTFLANPLLPDTQAELAVPLVARGQLLGVLDIQSDQINYFDHEVLAVIELLAGQIATAISNAQLYEVAERTSRHERALGTIDRKIQGAVDMDDILQTTVRELGKALRVPHTAIELHLNGSEDKI